MNGVHGLQSDIKTNEDDMHLPRSITTIRVKYKLLFRLTKLLYYSIKHGINRESYILTSNKEHAFRRLLPQQTNSQIFFVERMSGGRGTAKRLSRIHWTQHKILSTGRQNENVQKGPLFNL